MGASPDIAAQAVAASMSMECKKDGLSQLQDGSWVLKLKVHPSEMSPALLTAGMGTRFMAVLVEINDNETPVSKEEQAERSRPIKTKKRWNELPLSQQAAIRCGEPGFRMYISERYRIEPDEQSIADAVRKICVVQSRRDISAGTTAGDTWAALDDGYQFWLRNADVEA